MYLFVKSRSFIRMAFYLFLIAFCSLFFSFLAAPALRVVEQRISRVFYWSYGLLWLLLMWHPATFMLGLLLLKIWFVIGIYGELEFKFALRPYLNMSLSALGSTLLVVCLGYWIANSIHFDVLSEVEKSMGPLLKGTASEWLPVSFISLVPAILFFLNLSNLVFAIALDRRFSEILSIPFSVPVKHPRLLDFRASEFLIWPFLLTLFGAFYKGTPELASKIMMNLMISFAGIFFFQGLAVVESLLYAIRAGLLVRILVYVLLVGQMFLLLVAIGLVDYWVDIRSRFTHWFKKK